MMRMEKEGQLVLGGSMASGMVKDLFANSLVWLFPDRATQLLRGWQVLGL